MSGQYIRSAPSAQNALDIFKGQWWSRLPGPFAGLRAGQMGLFEDPRVDWAISEFGDVAGKSILELGPLEGAHSYALERAGFGSVTGIEGNPQAFLKCLVVKEIVGLTRTRFLCGDFVEYLRDSPPRFDAVFASGVLYHMTAPAELLALVSKVTDRLFLWTHYYDANLIRGNRKLAARFTGEHTAEHSGFQHTLIQYRYWGSFGARRFCGGPRSYSHWMRREDILGCLRHFGFTTVRINFEVPDQADGPAFAVVALRG